MAKQDLISIKDLSLKEIEEIFLLTDKLKENKQKILPGFKRKNPGPYFSEAIQQNQGIFRGGDVSAWGFKYLFGAGEINLGVREAIKDVAQTLSRYVQGIVLRTFEHKNVIELARYASVPVINGLSDLSHPCQALADLYTIKEKFGSFKGRTLTYCGDGNNVTHSLLYGCAKIGLNLNIATPKKFEPDSTVFKEALGMASVSGARISLSRDPLKACKNADVIYTDVWTSMGQEKEARARRKIFRDYQINQKLVSSAKKNCLIMHCLPAHRERK